MTGRRPSLASLYRELAAAFWRGQLPPLVPRGCAGTPAHIVVRRIGRPPGDVFVRRLGKRCEGVGPVATVIGRFVAPGPHTPARIHVQSPLSAVAERQVLLHQMVHARLHFAGWAEGHGPRFVAELQRLAAAGEAWAEDEAAFYAARSHS